MNLVYLCSRKYWDHKMSRGARFHCPLAVGEHPGVSLTCIGPGFEGWDDQATAEDNLKRFEPDVVWAYKPEDVRDFRSVNARKVVTMNECWWPDNRAMREAEEHGIDVVICHHHNDAPRFNEFSGKVVHIPHSAKAECFTGYEGPKLHEAIFTGVDSAEIYPVRHTLKRMVLSGQIPGTIRNHPGYRLRSEQDCERQFRDYGRALQEAKVSLVCSSRYRYALAKYIESAAAGALVVGDMPHDPFYADTLGRFIVNISGMKQEEIAQKVAWWLSHPAERLERVSQARHVYERVFGMERYAGRFVRAVA